MKREGPDITALTHRLAACPEIFLRTPLMQSQEGGSGDQLIGEVHTGAVLSDLFFAITGEDLNDAEIQSFTLRESANNRKLLGLELLAAYILFDERLRACELDAGRLREFFLKHTLQSLAELNGIVRAFVADAERREELVRRILAHFDLRPAGENEFQAQDRLQTLDSVERERVINESRRAQERAEELRAALARKRAQEAASKMSRE